MLADALDHRQRAAVAHRKSLARAAGHIELSRRCSIEHRVAHQHVAALRTLRPRQ